MFNICRASLLNRLYLISRSNSTSHSLAHVGSLSRTSAPSHRLLTSSLNSSSASSPSSSSSSALSPSPISSCRLSQSHFSTKPEGTALVDRSSGGNSVLDCSVENFDFLPAIKKTIVEVFKIKELFPIQAEVFAPVRAGRNLVGRSRTGTGKTLAFVLPIVERLLRTSPASRPNSCHVLILEPTRELANQVAVEVERLVDRKLSVLVLYGGTPYFPQEQALKRGVDIVIATPGRLLDHVEKKNIRLNNVISCVLDEADEMLRMGFVEPVEDILSEMPPTKQLLLFSATMPSWVSSLVKKHAQDAVLIDKVSGTEGQTSLTVSHKVICSPNDINAKVAVIRGLIKSYASNFDEETQTNTNNNGFGRKVTKEPRVIIFAPTKADTDHIATLLTTQGCKARGLHGDVPQSRREIITADFREQKFSVLVATDVAARGLDIPDVALVVQTWFPDDVEQYVHRSGRTGRAGRTGTSVILYHPRERRFIASLSTALKVPVDAIYPPQASSHVHPEKFVNAFNKNMLKPYSKSFLPVAQILIQQHGPDKALSSALAHIFSRDIEPRSILTSNEGQIAIKVLKQARSQFFDPAARIAQLLKLGDDFDVSDAEYYSGGAVVDVPAHVAEDLQQVLADKPEIVDVEVCSTLPVELFQEKGGSSRSGSFSSSRRGGGGGRGFGRGGAGSGGRSSFGRDRESSFGRDRESSFGRDRESRFGSGDRSGFGFKGRGGRGDGDESTHRSSSSNSSRFGDRRSF